VTIIAGIDVQSWLCDECGAYHFHFFKGMGGEGYKISCVNCGEAQLELMKELKTPYLWRHLESPEQDNDEGEEGSWKPRHEL